MTDLRAAVTSSSVASDRLNPDSRRMTSARQMTRLTRRMTGTPSGRWGRSYLSLDTPSVKNPAGDDWLDYSPVRPKASI